MTRVVTILLDAVEWSYVEELMDRGELPHLAALRGRAAECRLRSPWPYRAEAPWNDFLSGRSPSARRFWSAVAFEPDTYECYLRGTAPVDPFYALGPDRTVIALDVPKSILTDDVHGCQVIGWGAHDGGFPRCSSPRGLLEELEAAVGTHPGVAIEYGGGWHQPEFLARFAAASADGVARRVAALAHLQERYPDWDLLVVAMGEAHTAGHNAWHGVAQSLLAHAPSAPVARRSLLDIHAALDRAVGDVVASVPDDATIAVVSPLGMGDGSSEIATMMLLPELFHRLQFGAPQLHGPDASAWARRRYPPIILPEWDSHSRYVARRFGRGKLTTRVVATREDLHTRLRPILHRTAPGLVALRRRLRAQPVPASELAERDDDVAFPLRDFGMYRWHVATWYREHWPAMPWFIVPSFGDAHVRINLEGREQSGMVPRAEYEQACADVERVLGECRDVRTGRALVEDVVRIRADDPFAPDGPSADLVVRVVDGVDAIEHPHAGIIGPFPAPRVGQHDALGFALIAGPGIAAANLGEYPLVDMSATIVALAGCAPPPEFEGHPIPAVADYVGRAPPR